MTRTTLEQQAAKVAEQVIAELQAAVFQDEWLRTVRWSVAADALRELEETMKAVGGFQADVDDIPEFGLLVKTDVTVQHRGTINGVMREPWSRIEFIKPFGGDAKGGFYSNTDSAYEVPSQEES